MSLEQLATRARVSAGLLSQIERGLGNPSVTTLFKIANALNIAVGSLFRFAGPTPADELIVRRTERKRLTFPRDKITHELLTPDLQGHFAVMRSLLPPGFNNELKPMGHVGEEFLLILSGEVEVYVDGSRYILNAGDSITYDSSLPHYWRNAGRTQVELIGVVNPPPW
jgi:transcriptional regulator with XRE-family HTH domain